MHKIGWLVLLIIGLIYLSAAFGLASKFELSSAIEVLSQPYIISVIKFTLLQASLSTALSIVLAIPIARALHRQQFIGKNILLIVSGLCLVIPVIVAVLGIVSIHGGRGWISTLLNIETSYLYSLVGILIAHVFFNLPLAVRVLLQSLYTVPESSWRLTSHLGLNSWHIFKLIEWPLFRSQLPATAGLIFLLCFTSFAVVLVFGGGLKYSTLEVTIYQALRFDFDISKAVIFAIIQVAICIAIFLLLIRYSRRFALQDLSAKSAFRDDGGSIKQKFIDYLALSIFFIWIVLPILAIAINGLQVSDWKVIHNSSFYSAIKGSILVSFCSGIVAIVFAVSLCYLSKQLMYSCNFSRAKSAIIEILVQLSLIFPAFVLATGLFIILKKHLSISGPVIVVMINCLAILPFMVRVLLPAILSTHKNDHLAASLGISGFNRFKLVDWPIIRKSYAWALGIGLALALGDFSVIALFGSQDFVTLPLYLYRLMGAYKMDQAAVVGLVICLLCLLVFYGCNRFIGKGGKNHA